MNRQAARMLAQLQAQARRGDVRNFHSFQAMPGYQDPSMGYLDPAQGQGFRDSGLVGTNSGLPLSSPTPGNVDSSAQFGITITRPTITIAGLDLPAALFAPIDAVSGYRNLLSGELPSGVTVSKVEFGSPNLPNNLTITFTDGVNTDTLVITCSSTAYPGFLQSMFTDKFEVNKVRVTLSDDTQTDQFNKRLKVKSFSPFGLGSENGTPPSNFRTPQQFQSGIVDIDLKFKFDKQTGIVLPIIPVAAFSVNLNFFCPRFDQESARFW